MTRTVFLIKGLPAFNDISIILFMLLCIFYYIHFIYILHFHTSGFNEDLEMVSKSAMHSVQHCVILGIAGCLRFMCDLSAPHLLFKHLLLGCTLFISFKKGAVPSHSSFRDPFLSLDQSIIYQK